MLENELSRRDHAGNTATRGLTQDKGDESDERSITAVWCRVRSVNPSHPPDCGEPVCERLSVLKLKPTRLGAPDYSFPRDSSCVEEQHVLDFGTVPWVPWSGLRDCGKPGQTSSVLWMARDPRSIETPGRIVEVTSRTVHGRYLMRPSGEVNEIILGIVGRGEIKYGVELYAFVFLSNHFHVLMRECGAWSEWLCSLDT